MHIVDQKGFSSFVKAWGEFSFNKIHSKSSLDFSMTSIFFKSEVYLLIDSIIEVKRKQAMFSAYNAFLEKVKPTQMQKEICAVYYDWSKVSEIFFLINDASQSG